MEIETELLEKALELKSSLFKHSQLCRAQIEMFEKEIRNPGEVLVACTQEAPMFLETTSATGNEHANIQFTNIRERAGWCKTEDKKNVGPKMAALIAEAAIEIPPTPSVSMKSNGELLIIGENDKVMEAAQMAKNHLNVSVILSEPNAILPPHVMEFPIFCGNVLSASGHLGAFELKITDYSPARPASKQSIQFDGVGQKGTVECDLILDLREGPALFNNHERRDGYFKPDTSRPNSLIKAILDLSNLVGEFEKPQYIDYDSSLCAHSRSEIPGCTRCIDSCSLSAISSQEDHVVFDPFTCAGCGVCSGICPTGAAKFALPAEDTLILRIKTLIHTFLKAGGKNPIILVHDNVWGSEMIASLARHFDGLPGNILPLAVTSPSQVGLESIFSAASYGAERILYMFAPAKTEEKNILKPHVEIANIILDGLGYDRPRVLFIEELDPENVSQIFHNLSPMPGMPSVDFLPMGNKRAIMGLALNHLHTNAPKPVDIIDLPKEAPFGAINVTTDGCTLCLSCVGACPTGALKANDDKPQLSFSETACVQCGLCKNTCPEKVITLQPRISFRTEAHSAKIIKEETPFKCVKCGKPFGTQSTIEKMLEKLNGHPMFKDKNALNRLKMCDDCRVVSMTEDTSDPLAIGIVPTPRTTDDYLREREQLRRDAAKDMMDKGLLPPEGEA